MGPTFLGKAEEPEIKLSISVGSYKKQGNFRNIYFRFIDYAKASDCMKESKSESRGRSVVSDSVTP